LIDTLAAVRLFPHFGWPVFLSACTVLFPLERTALVNALDAGSSAVDGGLFVQDAGEGVPSDASGPPVSDGAAGDAVAPGTYGRAVLVDLPIAYYPLDEVGGGYAVNALASDGEPRCETVRIIQWGRSGIRGGGTAAGSNSSGHFECLSPRFDFSGKRPFSLEMWVRFLSRDSATFYYPFSHYKDVNGYGMYVNDSYGATLQRVVDGRSVIAGTLQNAVPVGSWVHLVGTFDGADLRVFANGTLGSIQASADSMAEFASRLVIGTSNMGTESDADFDEIAIYDYALNATRIAAHYDAGKQ
jgi:Concanavalin A-like lectin/glucanases superfamily